jgi:hypothetical protein
VRPRSRVHLLAAGLPVCTSCMECGVGCVAGRLGVVLVQVVAAGRGGGPHGPRRSCTCVGMHMCWEPCENILMYICGTQACAACATSLLGVRVLPHVVDLSAVC